MSSKIELSGVEVPYEVSRSEDATRVRIDSRLEGIRVVIPENADISPEKVLRERPNWVVEKWTETRRFLNKIDEKKFEDGESFLLKGDEIILETGANETGIKNGKLLARAEQPEKVEEDLRELFREIAREIIGQKCKKFSESVSEDYDKLYIRNQKTRWGSCSSKNNLSFNWRIIMAPEEIIDYVVCHEIAHLEVDNHSEKFWSKVSELNPDYESCMEWLEENKHRLAWSKKDVLNQSS